MTSYRVIVTPEAEGDISEAFDYIAMRSPQYAEKWIRGLYKLVDSLEAFPRRFGNAREQRFFEEELPQVVFKSHRIIYTIDDAARAVVVVRVRHAKRPTVGEQDDDN